MPGKAKAETDDEDKPEQKQDEAGGGTRARPPPEDVMTRTSWSRGKTEMAPAYVQGRVPEEGSGKRHRNRR